MARHKFSGVLPPILTPLKSADTVDVPAMKRHTDSLINAGCHGIFVCGTTGEGPNLTLRSWQGAVEAVAEAANGRAPVYAGAIDVSLARVKERLNILGKIGVDAAVVTAPFYFRHEGADLLEHFRRAADSSPVDVLIYNIPQMVACSIPASVVLEAQKIRRIIGVKDSSGDWELMQTMLHERTRSDFEILCGNELIMGAAMLCGADGIVPGAANFNPSLTISLYEAGRSKDVDKTFELQRRLVRMRRFYAEDPSPLVAMKVACEMLGICGPATSFTYETPTAERVERIRSLLESEGLPAL